MPKSQAQSTPKSKSVLTAAGTCAAAGLVAEGLVCTIDGLVGDGPSREAQAALQTGTINVTVTTGATVTVTFGGHPAGGSAIQVEWDGGTETWFEFSCTGGAAHGRLTSSVTGKDLVGVTTGSIDGAGFYWDMGKVHAGVEDTYVGVKFPNGGGAGQVRYGWIELGTYVADTSIQVLTWGFEDTGAAAPIPVPEPGTLGLGLLALGAAGVTAYKRRRSNAKQGTAGE